MRKSLILLCILPLFLHALPSYNESMGFPKRLNTQAHEKTPLFAKSYNENNYEIAASPEVRIPKIIHHIWIGSPLPEKYRQFVESWRKIHPEWEHRLWTDDDIDSFDFTNRELFDRAKNYGMKSDIWRCEILYQYGGLYVDTDFLALKPLDGLHTACDFYTGIMHTQKIANGLIASAPGHPILKQCIDQIHHVKGSNFNRREIMRVTGPDFFTEVVFDYLKKEGTDGIAIYPRTFFYPFPHKGRFKFWQNQNTNLFVKKYVKPETLAIHFWAFSWF